MTEKRPYLYLSPPDVGERERAAALAALESGWVAPLGPAVDQFERDLAEWTDREHACALSSGTAALHLALQVLGVGAGDRVLVPTMTFVATANAVLYLGAEPIFVDSDEATWNVDPQLIEEALSEGAKAGRPIKAVIAVDLYGQCASYEQIDEICKRHGVPLIADSAESLGASYQGKPAGSFGDIAILSFNGNKIITTSGGGALLTDHGPHVDRVRHLATQARMPVPHYEHEEMGYNYRLSNILAAIGSAQLAGLGDKVERRREINQRYQAALGGLPGVRFAPVGPGSTPSCWLTTLTFDPNESGVTRDGCLEALGQQGLECRPTWKPMHLQPMFQGARVWGGEVSARVFRDGVCLPSGSSMTDEQQGWVIEAMLELKG